MNWKKIIKFLIKAGAFSFLAGGIIFFSLLLYYSKDLPQPEKFTERQISEPTKIYDRSGEVLLRTIFGEEKREIVTLDEMSPHIKQAVVVAEDRRFYNHFGIDIKGIMRALIADLKKGSLAQGGSTISQQLIRSTFLTPQKTIGRKVREIILSLELDAKYSKEEILEWYLNQVPFGANAYGIEAASQTYFSKRAQDLTIAESAALAGLIQAPERLSPYRENKHILLERKNRIIDLMVEEEMITREEADEAKKQELEFKKESIPMEAPHFVLEVQKQLIRKYGEENLKEEGLIVHTTLDMRLQEKAEEAIDKWAERNESMRCYNEALVAIDPQTGEVLALVGSKDYFAEEYPEGCTPGKDCLYNPEFNVAVLGERQPGSAIKPLVYAEAFERGYSDQYVVVDEPTNFGIWGGETYAPKNYDGLFRGPVTLRQALAQSLNVPSVKVLMYLAGLENGIEKIKEMGISTLKDPSYYGPSIVLGGGEVTLLDLTSAYSVFANRGLRNKPHVISSIKNKRGETIESANEDPKRVLSTRSAQMVSSILSDNQARSPMFGPNSALYVNDDVAAKTGTTQHYQDAWIVGYNSQITAGVWAGNNDSSSTYNKPGVTLAGPIWNDFMTEAIKILGE